MPAPFRIGDQEVAPGERRIVDLPVSILSDHTPVTMSVHVVHGRRPGPVMFVSAAVHGDEVIGVEIVRRLLRARNLETLRGTLLAVPIVNAFGFMNQSRYLPDRRDLNRSFPGGPKGSLAARLAHLFMEEIVARSDVGIDLHSAAIHRGNLPQLRVASTTKRALQMAQAFGAPVILKSELREGSLRQAAIDRGVDLLLYEAGEALRFDEFGVRVGVSGCLRVMHALEMIPSRGIRESRVKPMVSTGSRWVRAPVGGLLRTFRNIGDSVDAGETLGIISDPFGQVDIEVPAPEAGLIIGRNNLPVLNEGDALFHVARLASRAQPEQTLDTLVAHLDADPLFDEDEII
ncbi:MAG: succinylglutamate desuccinylase/aspartoacylase family protein [Guyparkeria sp.]|uniref:succinylglutamate desuccinylase/aspartoacylase family protein n=1 Tax=Guyparkeria sp. TaxID=2035736 RepID=UPI00397E094C